MKLGSKSYWLLFLTFLVLAAFQATLRGRVGSSSLEFLVRPTEQAGSLRIEELKVEPRALSSPSQTSGTAPSLQGPVRLASDTSGELLVIDEGAAETVKQLKVEGGATHELSGLRALQVKSVTSLVATPEDLWIADLLASSIYRLDRHSGVWTTRRLALEPYRVAPLERGRRLAILRVGTPLLLDLTDADGKPLRSFGNLLKNQHRHALALDGYLATSNESILFSGKYVGVLASFSSSGDLQYLVKTIAPPSAPLVVERGKSRWVEHGALLAASDLAVRAGTLYSLTHRRSGIQVRAMIDLYSVLDGSYQKTLVLPAGESWRSIAVGPEGLFAASASRVAHWPVRREADGQVDNKFSTGRSITEFQSKTDRKEGAT